MQRATRLETLSQKYHRDCRVEALSKWIKMHPLRNSASMKAGVVGRDGCTNAVGPHSRRIRMQMRRRSRVSRAGCTHAQNSGQTTYKTGYSHGDRPHMAITDVHHICHIGQIKCTRKHDYQHLRVPSSHVRSEAENA